MWREKGEGEGELGSLDHWGNAADAQERRAHSLWVLPNLRRTM